MNIFFLIQEFHNSKLGVYYTSTCYTQIITIHEFIFIIYYTIL